MDGSKIADKKYGRILGCVGPAGCGGYDSVDSQCASIHPCANPILMGVPKTIEIANGHAVGNEKTCLGREMLCAGSNNGRFT